MKKLKIVCMAVFAAMVFFSCKDETGDYVEQLYTNTQKEASIKACLRASVDTTSAHLFVTNGFYMYKDSVYRIDFAPLQNTLFSILKENGYGYLVDSLVLSANRLVESCGTQVTPYLQAAVDSLKIVDYDALINGKEDAITSYYELYEYRYLKSVLQIPVSVRMDIYNVNGIWALMMNKYIQFTNTPLNFDILNYMVETMLSDIFAEMRIEESLIRTDEMHRTSEMDAMFD